MLLIWQLFAGMPHKSSLSLSFCVSLSSISVSWRLFAASVSFSFSVQKRTRTCVGRCSRRSLRLRRRSVCPSCDCKKQQQPRKLNNKFSSRVCMFTERRVIAKKKIVSIKSRKSQKNCFFIFFLLLLLIVDYYCY